MNRGGKLLLVSVGVALAACSTQPSGVEVRAIADPSSKVRGGSDRLADARAQFVLGNVGLALEGFRKASRERPDDAEAFAGMAACYEAMGRYDLAQSNFEAALALAPRSTALLAGLAGTLERQGKREAAANVRAEVAQLNSAAAALAETPAEPAPLVAVAVPAPKARVAVPAIAPKAIVALPLPAPRAMGATAVAAVPAPRAIVAAAVAAAPVAVTIAATPVAVAVAALKPLPAVVLAAPKPPVAVPASTPKMSFAAAATQVTVALPAATPIAVAVAPPVAEPVAQSLPREAPPVPRAALPALNVAEILAQVDVRSDPLAPRLQRLSPGEVALVTQPRAVWRGQVVSRSTRSVTVRWVPLAMASARPNIRLLNAARRQGLAARSREYLLGRGWRKIEIGNSAIVRNESVVFYPAGRQATARSLAAQFGIRARPVAKGNVLVVLLGRDWIRPAQSRG